MMGAAAFAVLLANAVIGNGREERSGNRFLHGAAAVLVVAVLPLAKGVPVRPAYAPSALRFGKERM